ncbi:hypothetical protein GCM10012280_58270 [Wenjunlia tyrosinilytica]|uniref:Uncharacterized protein n=1 Tax=Wenjunlia tyrosinilytica TaxID=1544741 RepID=A0A917ZXF6_9ACTN|nr:hypothetical protein GCM10012280_58270 [Wenjunlia tyrosinilytica]
MAQQAAWSDLGRDLAAQVAGSGRGALPGLLPVGFPDPAAEPGVPVSEHRALHEIHAVGIGPVRASGQGLGMLLPR